MEFYERYAQSKGLLDSALKYLSLQSDIENNKKQNRDYIRVYYLLKDYNKVTGYAGKLQPANVNDASTAYRAGEAYYQLQHADSALPWYRRATEIWKFSLDFQKEYGICLLALNKIPEATEVFNFILKENPNNVSANTNLGYIYMQEGNNAMAYDYMMRANKLDPDYEQNLINLAVWYHSNNQPDKAQKALMHLITRHPENERAKAMLIDLSK